MDSVVVVIPARYESSRLPGKPLADIEGKPMIQRVYERASQARGVDRVLVATDDERIRDAVSAFGGDVAMTSSEHTTGTDRIAEAVADLDYDIIVNVQGDLPLLDPDNVAVAVDPMIADDLLPMATLKTPIREQHEIDNPNVVKVVTNTDGGALYFSRSPLPYWRDGFQGDVQAYRHIGLYVYRREILLLFNQLEATPLEKAENLEQLRALEHGYQIQVVEVADAGVEVDTPADLDMVRKLVRRSGGGCHE